MFIENAGIVRACNPFVHDPMGLLPIQLEAKVVNGKRTYFLPNGAKYPSVTTVLSDDDGEGLRKWKESVGPDEAAKISSRATKRGSVLHEHLEKYIKNEEISLRGMMPDQKLLIKSVLPTLNGINKVILQESCLYSTALKIAGRFDLIGEWNGKLSVVDFKSSGKPKQARYIENYFMQCAAYAVMFSERYGFDIDQLVVVIAVEDSAPQVFIEQTHDWLPKLIAKVNAYHNKNKNEEGNSTGN